MDQQDKFECELEADDLKKFGPNSWLVRPCEWYKQEYSDCKSLRGRIHQYFVHGKTNICDDWRDDFYNCKLFRKTKEPQYVNRIIESELNRKAVRKQAEHANDVWEYRTNPPADWNRYEENKEKTTTKAA